MSNTKKIVIILFFISLIICMKQTYVIAITCNEIDNIKYLANKGDIDAITKLGIAYNQGVCVEQNYYKSRELFEKAAKNGNSDAMVQLGLLHLNGKSVSKNKQIARNLFEKAALQNNPLALLELGKTYSKGYSIDFNKAEECFKKAYKLGNSDALYELSIIYEKIDKNKYIEYLNKSANLNNIQAMRELARVYADNENYEKEKELNIKIANLWEQNAINSTPDEKIALSNFYGWTIFDKKKEKIWEDKAIIQLKKLALNGSIDAKIDLYKLYKGGINGEHDEITANKWRKMAEIQLKKLATQGDADAQFHLGSLYGKPDGLIWWEKAALQGHRQAAYSLGVYYDDLISNESLFSLDRYQYNIK